jgi:hypothetical protein
MRTLYENLKNLAEQDHPYLDLSALRSVENVVHTFEDGSKVLARISDGKIADIKVVNTHGHEMPSVKFQLAGGSPAPRPNCIRVCMSYPISTEYGEGVTCWWIEGEKTW